MGIQRDIKKTPVELLIPACARYRRISFPVSKSAIRNGTMHSTIALKRIEQPNLFPGFRIDRYRAARLGGEVEHAVHHQWSAFESMNPTVGSRRYFVSPRALKLPDIFGVDLFQGRKARPAGIVAVSTPLRIRGTLPEGDSAGYKNAHANG